MDGFGNATLVSSIGEFWGWSLDDLAAASSTLVILVFRVLANVDDESNADLNKRVVLVRELFSLRTRTTHLVELTFGHLVTYGLITILLLSVTGTFVSEPEYLIQRV